jgi:Zn-dependent M28 family amino/carboxypeptidase
VTSRWGNVVGAIQGKSLPNEVIIFSAHYDHIGTKSTNPAPFAGGKLNIRNGDTIYNGANDDASGVCAIISLAKFFAKQENIERTIIFVAFAGEELGDLGSGYFASLTEPSLVKAVVNIEMIGRNAFNNGKPYMTGSELTDLYEILNKRLYEENRKMYSRRFIQQDDFPKENLFMRSDNYPFAKLGIPAHTIMTTAPTDMYYHSPADEASTLDYKLMSKIIKAIAISCRGLVTGEDTPQRITHL